MGSSGIKQAMVPQQQQQPMMSQQQPMMPQQQPMLAPSADPFAAPAAMPQQGGGGFGGFGAPAQAAPGGFGAPGANIDFSAMKAQLNQMPQQGAVPPPAVNTSNPFGPPPTGYG